MSKLRNAALFGAALLAVVGVSKAADMIFSTGDQFEPLGFMTPQGEDLNVIVDRVNGLSNGSFPITGNFAVTGTMTGTSNSASALAVGANGATNPALQVDASEASQATGIKITGRSAAAGSATVATISSASNASLVLDGKGTGDVFVGGNSTGAVFLGNGVNKVQADGAATTGTPTISAGGADADTNVSITLSGKGVGRGLLGTSMVTCTGTTTATCTGQRFTVSVTGLTTAASTAAAEMVVTNTSIPTSAANVLCDVNGYAGTGVPIATKINPGTNSVGITIQNVSTGAALNATVPVSCLVIN